MRLFLLLTCLATPLSAWEFRSDPICTLARNGVVVTFDPDLPEYRIAITLPSGVWPEAPIFGIAFDGVRSFVIQTDRHMLSTDGTTLTVVDRGFGNVLDGLEFGTRAVAFAGEASVNIPLDDIGPAIRAFRDCPSDALS
ncbi:excinuclease ABC subunit B [Yoonia sp. 2307UL14-13]|uniref:excinuclease ABC subunit B n=1 Tax=Yoonia sp. 2307UL14-13 TaxID=3126506 RepID=UPI00309FE139